MKRKKTSMDVNARCCSAIWATEAEESAKRLIAKSRRCVSGIADSWALVWMTFNTSGFTHRFLSKKKYQIKKLLIFPIISF